MTGPTAEKPRLLPQILVAEVFLAYLGHFLATRLPSMEGAISSPEGGGVFRRADFLVLLVCPDYLLANWLGSPPEFALVDRLPVLLVAGAILGVAGCLGWLLLKAMRLERSLNGLEVLVFAFAAGLNAISTYVLAVGLLGWLHNAAVFVVPGLAAIGLFGWLRIVRPASQRKSESARSRAAPKKATGATHAEESSADAASRRWLWAAVPFGLLIVLGAMLPPVDFDVREYHLQVPKEFYQQGRVAFLPHNVYGNMAMGTEMLSLLAMAVARDWWLGALAGKTVIAAFPLLTALGLVAAGRRFFSPQVGVLAAVIYLSIPWVILVSTTGLVEGAAACYLFLAVYAVLLWRSEGRPLRLAILAGYLAGSAVATKYPAALFVLVPLTIWVWMKDPHPLPLSRKRERGVAPEAAGQAAQAGSRWRSVRLESLTYRSGLAFVLAAAVGCGLWFGKNLALTGNPTYPLLYSIFDGKNWTAEKEAQWNNVHLPHDFSPATLGSDLVRVGLKSEWLSPLVMPLAALGLFVPAYRRRLVPLALYFAFMIAVWWLFTHRIDRFWIPVLPLVAMAAGVGACWNPGRIGRRLLVAWLGAGLVVSFLMAGTTSPGKDARLFVSLSRLRSDPLRVSAWHRYLNLYAGDGRVLLVGDAEVFDLEMPILYSTCFDDSLFEEIVRGHTAAEIRREFQARGITHVFVDWGEIQRYRQSRYGFTDFVQPEVFDDLVKQGILNPLPVIEGSLGRGYEVRRMGFDKQVSCLRSAPALE